MQRLCPTVLVRQAGQLRLGVREQALDRLGELALCRVEGPCLALEGGVVMLQPVVVQVVDERDLLDPFLAPFGQRHLAGRALDEVASLMCPEMLHATSLGVCCGQQYDAERLDHPATHENPPSLRNIIF